MKRSIAFLIATILALVSTHYLSVAEEVGRTTEGPLKAASPKNYTHGPDTYSWRHLSPQ